MAFSTQRMSSRFKYLDEKFIDDFKKINVRRIAKDLGFSYFSNHHSSARITRMVRVQLEKEITELMKRSLTKRH